MSSSQFLAPATLAEALSVLAEPARPVVLAGGTDLWPQWTSGAPLPRAGAEPAPAGGPPGGDPPGWVAPHRRRLHPHRAGPGPGGPSKQARRSPPPPPPSARSRSRTRAPSAATSPTPAPPPICRRPSWRRGARLELACNEGTRLVELHRFYKGYREVRSARERADHRRARAAAPPAGREHFRKVGTRQAQAISKVVGSLPVGPRRGGAVHLRGVLLRQRRAHRGPLPRAGALADGPAP